MSIPLYPRAARGISLMMVGFGGVAFIIQYYTEKILFASVGRGAVGLAVCLCP